MIIMDRLDSTVGGDKRWTFGTEGHNGNFAGAYPDGTVNLHGWSADNDIQTRKVKCRSYRRAIRLLRWHLMGYNV